MGGFLGRRIALVLPTLVLVSILVFGLQQLMPGDPALALAGGSVGAAIVISHSSRPIDLASWTSLGGSVLLILAAVAQHNSSRLTIGDGAGDQGDR